MIRRIINYLKVLREGAYAAKNSEWYLKNLLQLQLESQLRDSPRFKDPKRLLSAGFKAYSQGPEDGMINEVFRRIGTTSKRFIEFGIEEGLECNSTLLLLDGWSGTWIEGSAMLAGRAKDHFKAYPIEVLNQYVTPENADQLIAKCACGKEVDMLSIDTDYYDYYIWNAIHTTKARLVVIEYNATLPPYLNKTIAYTPNHHWDGSNYFGASLGALEKLGRSKGYSLVGCSASGVNAFFVRQDLVEDKFCQPFTAENHYQAPLYALMPVAGHRPGMGKWIDI